MNKPASSDELPVIKTLWIGPSLSMLEQLSLKSFLANGHRVELFVYDQVNNVPDGVTLRDAEQVLSSSKIFVYKHGKSVAGFANWFRYQMLLSEGGIWVDTDVICLKPFQFESQELTFGKEEYRRYNNAVLGGVAGHPLFQFMSQLAESPNTILPYDSMREKRRKWKRKYLQGNQRGNIKFGEVGPSGLTKAVHHFGLGSQALPYTAFYPIHCKCWDAIFDETYPSADRAFPDSYAIHLWNEMMRQSPGFDKNARFPEHSLIEGLKQRYLNL